MFEYVSRGEISAFSSTVTKGIFESADTGLFSTLAFEVLIEKRKNYLEKLTNLPVKWISGRSERPDLTTINASKAVLDIARYYFRRRKVKTPNMLIGPMPIGGICIEFHFDNTNAIYLSLYNDNRFEMEIKHNDYYREVTVNVEQISSQMMETYDAITEK